MKISSFFLLCSLSGLMIPAPASAAEQCPAVPARALYPGLEYLQDAHGNISKGALELGDVKIPSRNADWWTIRTEYSLLVHPKGLRYVDRCHAHGMAL